MTDSQSPQGAEGQVGRTLGPYQLKRLLGRGGMGEVYEAIDTRLDRVIAIKLLRPEVVQDETRRARFEREAKALAALKHPSIVTIYSIESIEGMTLITMELVAGTTLSAILKSERNISVDRVLELAIPIADALSAAHKQGIVHRDIKPENIIVGANGKITVLDFGLAKLAGPVVEDLDPDEAETQVQHATVEGRILGTVHYMSPEQAQGQQISASTDVFALGVVLYEMATGASPFEGETTLSRLSSILKDEPVQMMRLNDQVPAALDRIVHRCLAKDPDRRWQTATDVRNELEIIQEARREGTEIVPEVDLRPRKGRILLGSVCMVVLFCVAVFAYWLGSGSSGIGVVSHDSTNGVQPPDAVSLLAPEGYELLGVQISPDGRTLAMHTAKPEASARTSAKAGIVGYLHLRNMDSFETVLVPSSRGTEEWRFSPDGKALIFMVMPETPSDAMAIMRLDLPADVPPVQIGTILQATIGVQLDDTVQNIPRGFSWFNADTIVAVTETSNTLLQINARTGSETARIPLQFKQNLRVIRVLDAIDESTILLGTDRYAEGRYLQEVHWADVKTGSTGLILSRTSEAKLASGDSLVFTRGATLFEIGYDAAARRTSGQERPVLSGLRTPNTWSGAVFDLSNRGSIAYLPGGVQGSERALWRHTTDRESFPLPFSKAAFEEGLAVSGDGGIVLVTTTDVSDGMWSLAKGSMDPPRLRSFVSVSDRDVFAPILSSNGKMAAAMTHTSVPSRRTAIVTFDPSKSGDLDEIIHSEREQLMPHALNSATNELLFSRSKFGDQLGTLEVVSLDRAANVRVLISEGSGYKNAAWSPDGRMLAYISSVTGQPEVYVASYSKEGLGKINMVSSGSMEALGWSEEGGGLFGLRMIGDQKEYMCTISLVGNKVDLGPLVETGRVLAQGEINHAFDLDGVIYTIRSGDNEQPAKHVQLITDWFSSLN